MSLLQPRRENEREPRSDLPPVVRYARFLVAAVIVGAGVLVFGGGTAHADIDQLIATTNASNVSAAFHVHYDDAAGNLSYSCVSVQGGPCPGLPGHWVSIFYNTAPTNFVSTGSPGVWTYSVQGGIITDGFGGFNNEQDAPLASSMIPLTTPVSFQFMAPFPTDANFVANSLGNTFAVHVAITSTCSIYVSSHYKDTQQPNPNCVGVTTNSN